jgi:hypothetical protein
MDTTVGWAAKPSNIAHVSSPRYYEHKKHDGSLPLIGVNTFLPKEHAVLSFHARDFANAAGGRGRPTYSASESVAASGITRIAL